ncbi:MAG: response regulator [Tannerellaceae bacterium]|jgi:signal transduction histidine kinase/ligand-binding sensor domain-containing protein/DNA-binding response OmpR family regulator|nr:response regulator [Tannerellaceae bacterium]
MKKELWIGILLLSFSVAYGQSSVNYRMYEHILLSREALSVRCFLQDTQGMIWVGSDKGLFSYDGFTPHPHFDYGDSTSLPVNCALLYGTDRLLLGSQKGILLYNYKQDTYEPFPLLLKDEIQSMTLVDKVLWIGSMGGLFRYDMEAHHCEKIPLGADSSSFPQPMVYSVLEDAGYIYVGSNVCFGRYSPRTKEFERLLPSVTDSRHEIVFANSLLKDEARGCIWVGTSNFLVKYIPATRSVEYKDPYSFIKAMSLDGSNRLVIGTDNGLCIYDESGIAYIKHDSRDSKSLANNIVWAVYADANRNIWLGTDYGISLSSNNRNFEYIPIHQLTHSGDGNHVYSIHKDSHGYYWLGGTSGLIRADDLRPGATSRWYMMNQAQWHISHNRIRHIFEDKEKSLWVLSDGGIDHYQYETGRFRYCIVADSSRQYHSAWPYHILEDASGYFWIATCMSGILVVDKERLRGAPYCLADQCYNTTNGLAGNFVTHIVPDAASRIWALVYNTGLDRIDPLTRRVEHIAMPAELGDAKPTMIHGDSDGYIWATFRGGVVKINAATLQMQTVRFADNPLAMTEVKSHLWISSAGGVWIVDKEALSIHHQNLLDRTFTGLYYDVQANHVCLGGIDGVAIAQPSLVYNSRNDSPIVITALHAAGGLSLPAGGYEGKSIRYLDGVRLPHHQNTFTLEFSDLHFSQDERSSFVYKLARKDESWHLLSARENTLSFTNLEPGEYTLQISRLGVNRQPSAHVRTFNITILPPWYATPVAQAVYVLLLLCLTLWTVYFFRVRNRLRFECMEKEKTIGQSQLKMDFFTEISHEFKTPLSLIIAFISQLLIESKRTPEEKKTFHLIYQNAMRLSSLIHQALDFYRDDNRTSVGLITSHIEFIGFARELFATCTEKMKDKQISFIFSSTLNSMYLNIDVIKIESVLNNLLSNACKYTRGSDTIVLSVDYILPDGLLEIRVSDTGVGIPAQDLPYIFQRFFQSPTHSAHKEGTGIGLYMAKKYVELHGGQIRVESDEESGTSFIVTLPVEQLPVAPCTDAKAGHPPEESNRPLIVVVEDNTDMAEFIGNMFASEYRCVTAHNGRIGLKLSMELLPDLIIADAMMPVMDGLEMCRRLKNHVPTSTIPIILLTAKDDKTTELHSIRLNIDAFIPKPFDLSILSSRVKQLIDSKKQIEKKIRIEILTEPGRMKHQVSYAEKLLANVTCVIEENLSDPDFNVDTLCYKVGISQKQVYRKIKELTGMTIIEYIKSIKMKKAALLLESRKFTVSEVMYMVGFNNHSYFAKCFYAQFGTHPNQYKETRTVNN